MQPSEQKTRPVHGSRSGYFSSFPQFSQSPAYVQLTGYLGMKESSR